MVLADFMRDRESLVLIGLETFGTIGAIELAAQAVGIDIVVFRTLADCKEGTVGTVVDRRMVMKWVVGLRKGRACPACQRRPGSMLVVLVHRLADCGLPRRSRTRGMNLLGCD